MYTTMLKERVHQLLDRKKHLEQEERQYKDAIAKVSLELNHYRTEDAKAMVRNEKTQYGTVIYNYEQELQEYRTALKVSLAWYGSVENELEFLEEFMEAEHEAGSKGE